MNTRHEASDTYVLQRYVKGKWVTDERVTKAGASNKARSAAKRAGVSFRVFNTSKNAVYCEARP